MLQFYHLFHKKRWLKIDIIISINHLRNKRWSTKKSVTIYTIYSVKEDQKKKKIFKSIISFRNKGKIWRNQNITVYTIYFPQENMAKSERMLLSWMLTNKSYPILYLASYPAEKLYPILSYPIQNIFRKKK